ncbi:MAG: M28 family metallopeptidase [Solirubrobacterales bacterium]
MTSPPSPRSALAAAIALALIAAGCGSDSDSGGDGAADRFDSSAAFDLIDEQVAVGRRPAGSPELRRLGDRLVELLPDGRFEPVGGGLRNVVGTLPGPGPAIVVGAHYDTEFHPPGFVGANDGAAGTAAVVELARALERELPGGDREVRFVLFDGEEEAPGCAEGAVGCSLRGSGAYAAAHRGEVGEVIVLDYVANRGLEIPREPNSDARLWSRLREAAARVGAERYFPAAGQTPIIDDHVPFLQQGIPAIDLIDFSYEHADTVEDTPDKLDPAALDGVGEAVAELVIELASREPQP